MFLSHTAGVALVVLLVTTEALAPSQMPRRYVDAPQPTDPPPEAAVLVRLQGLRKRDEEAASNDLADWTIAQDQTCGYLSGVPGNPITCQGENATCMWFAPIGTETRGGVVCADFEAESLTAYVGCINSETAQNTTECNDVCQSNEYILRCTKSSAPYCRTYAYPSNVSDYRCASVSQTRVSSVSWTWDGEDETDVGFITTTGFADEAATLTDIRSNAASPTQYVTIIHSSPASDSSSSKTPVGPIVGGVVGGLAVVGAVVLGAIYLLRHRRKPQPEQEAPQRSTTQPPQVQPDIPMTETKPYMGSPAPSYSAVPPFPPSSIGSPDPSHWRESSVISPQPSTAALATHAELSSNALDRSDSIHELPGDESSRR